MYNDNMLALYGSFGAHFVTRVIIQSTTFGQQHIPYNP